MKFMIDSANIDVIKKYNEILPVCGVTTNPSILKKEGKLNLVEHFKKIREIIGFDKSLHIQVVGTTVNDMLLDAKNILKKIDDKIFIKVPVNEAGLATIKILKSEGHNITATAIYTQIQGLLAIAANSDFIAPYYNRMENLNVDAFEVVKHLKKDIESSGSQTQILGASYKNLAQVNASINAGVHAITAQEETLNIFFAHPSINIAVDDFAKDFTSTHGSITMKDI